MINRPARGHEQKSDGAFFRVGENLIDDDRGDEKRDLDEASRAHGSTSGLTLRAHVRAKPHEACAWRMTLVHQPAAISGDRVRDVKHLATGFA